MVHYEVCTDFKSANLEQINSKKIWTICRDRLNTGNWNICVHPFELFLSQIWDLDSLKKGHVNEHDLIVHGSALSFLSWVKASWAN